MAGGVSTEINDLGKGHAMYQIDTNVPVPGRRKWSIKYPWHSMEVGDSFLVPDGNLKSLRASASIQKRKTNREYMVRAVEGGVRIWRTL